MTRTLTALLLAAAVVAGCGDPAATDIGERFLYPSHDRPRKVVCWVPVGTMRGLVSGGIFCMTEAEIRAGGGEP